jgi:phospholipid transport system substrate-binding protein
MNSLAILAALVLLSWPAATQGADQHVTLGGEAPAARDDTAAARAVVESFHEVLLGCMREADALGFQGRYDRIAASLDESFDLPFMARTLVGATWKELSQEQHDDFIELSRRLSASRYADNFDSYGGQRFETHSEEPAARGTIVVKTELIQPKDRNVLFDYRLRRVKGRWRIIASLVEALEKRVDELSRE